MMPDIFKWMQPYQQMQAATFAQGFWNLIQRNPSEIVVKRQGTTLAAQTVRISFSQPERETQAATSASTVRSRDVVIYGVKDHPDASVPDTDLRVGDIFSVDQRLFKITDVITNPGQIEAGGVAIS